jgi:prepilin-type processing-associated H-X9-DG protein
MAGERPPSADLAFGWWYTDGGSGRGGSTTVLLGVREIVGIRDARMCGSSRASFGPGSVWNQCDKYHFWSFHSGGAHFLFADGAVRFVSYSAADVLPALATRHGGEPVAFLD